MKKKKLLLTTLMIALCLALLVVIFALTVNAYVKKVGGDGIITAKDAESLEDVDCILVLGCQVRGEQPSLMLNHRLKTGVDLYKNGVAPKIIMSGDHGRTSYDEVNAMKKLAVEKGVLSEDVFMDHAGFSTYESMYRAKEIFGAKKIVIVSQEYHLYRAVYIAKKLGLEAYGVSAENYSVGHTYRENREFLARCKDFVKVIFKSKPTFLGEAIPISGNGNVTND